MIVVHHLNNSRSQRILWLLEELGVPFEIKRYHRNAQMQAPPELKAIHPLGKSPVITDGGKVIAESGAIIEYLLERYGKGRLVPSGEQEKIDFTYFLHYAEGSAMPPLLLALVFSMVGKAPVPFFVKPVVKGIVGKVNKTFIGPQLKTHLDFIEGHLAKNKWFAGPEFSAADIQMSYPVEAAMIRGGGKGTRPHMEDFLKRIHAMPTFQKALKDSGDDAMIPQP